MVRNTEDYGTLQEKSKLLCKACGGTFDVESLMTVVKPGPSPGKWPGNLMNLYKALKEARYPEAEWCAVIDEFRVLEASVKELKEERDALKRVLAAAILTIKNLEAALAVVRGQR